MAFGDRRKMIWDSVQNIFTERNVLAICQKSANIDSYGLNKK